ncbi:MAG: oxidoreductase, partial [Ginsengibacter sp.]
MKKYFYTIIISLFTFQFSFAQKIKILNSQIESSFRGLSVVDNNIVWVSGNNGMAGKSLDGGNTWKWIKIKGFEHTDFRDIEAFSATTAIIMGIGEP